MSFASLNQARAKRQAQSYVRAGAPKLPLDESEGRGSDPAVNEKTTTKLYSSLPPLLEIRTDPKSGRGIWTKSAQDGGVTRIPAGIAQTLSARSTLSADSNMIGTRLISVEPHAHALSTIHLPNLCTACHRISGAGGDSLKRCAKCRVIWYCSPASRDQGRIVRLY